MSKSFEEKIKAATESAQVDVASHNWDKIQHKLEHPFESAIQSKLEPFSQAPNPALWASIAAAVPNSMEAGIQDKVSGFEQAAPAGLWEGIANSMEEIPGSFESALQDKLGGLSAVPPAGMLEAIEAKMVAQNARDWKRIVAPILAMAAIAVLFVMLPQHTHDSEMSSFGNGLAQTDAATPSTTPSNTTIPAGIASAPTSNGNEWLEENLSDLSKDGTTPSYHTDNAHNRNTDVFLSAKDAEKRSVALAGLYGTPGSDNGSGNGGSINHGTTGNTASSLSRAESGLAFSRNVTASMALMKVFDVNLLEPLAPKFPFQISNADMPYDDASLARVESPEPTKVNTISVAAASGFFGTRNKSRYPSSNYGTDYVDFHNTLYTGGSYMSIGSDIQIAMSEKRSIVTGLSVTSGKQYMSFSTHKKEAPNYSLLRDGQEVVTNNYNPGSDLLNKKDNEYSSVLSVVDQSEIAGDSVINGNRYSLTNSFVFVDIPLGLNFKVVQKKKHSVNVRGGAQLRLVAGANTFHLTQNRDQVIEVSSAISQTFYQSSIAGFMAVDYSHEIGENIEWYIGPEVAMNFSDINKAGTWLSMRPVQAGISIGVRQQLN